MSILATAFLLVGIVGVIVPILPGIPFLVVAALLFTANSPGVRRRLMQSPQFGPYFRRINKVFAKPGADGLTSWERAKLKTLSALGALLPKAPRRR